jgi:hypothetical protein
MNLETKQEFVVAQTNEITAQGTAVFFEGDPPIILPLGVRNVEITTPTGRRITARASIEAARMVPPGEVLAMLFKSLSPAEIPTGSTITIVDV